jgi:hypothetical protein
MQQFGLERRLENLQSLRHVRRRNPYFTGCTTEAAFANDHREHLQIVE